jgi:LytR cell envelope-related transcriptional attenuator
LRDEQIAIVTVGTMNQRVPDSGGLPLRAMVMVLLFLGIIFLLLGINAVRTGSGSSSQATPVITTTTTTTSPTPTSPKADVRVYNISGVEGAAARAGERLTQAGWNVTVEPGTLELPEVTATTVFFTEAPGERESATEVAKVLDNAPVELRRPELVDLPPGVIVTVTG